MFEIAKWASFSNNNRIIAGHLWSLISSGIWDKQAKWEVLIDFAPQTLSFENVWNCEMSIFCKWQPHWHQWKTQPSHCQWNQCADKKWQRVVVESNASKKNLLVCAPLQHNEFFLFVFISCLWPLIGGDNLLVVASVNVVVICNFKCFKNCGSHCKID